MKIDPYHQCLCGSGKKIKFCSCGIDLHEAERLLKLINGEQYVAALDRINTLLKNTPNAAWLLALKAELALSLQERETFQQTVERFVQLQPSNPLALAMEAISVLTTSGNPQDSARLILESLAESKGAVPEMAADALKLLLSLLLQQGKVAMWRPWDSLALMLLGEEWLKESPLHEPSLNLLTKSISPESQPPADAPYRDRYKEAETLCKGMRLVQASTKLQALLRDFPGQLAPLMRLFDIQRTLIDAEGMAATATQLAQHPELSPDLQAYYYAMSLLADYPHGLQVATEDVVFEIPDHGTLVQKCLSSPNLRLHEGQESDQLRQILMNVLQEEIPPSHVFELVARAGDSGDGAANNDAPRGSEAGMLVVFGKQVDKPARLYATCVQFEDYPKLLREILDDLPLGADMPAPEAMAALHWDVFDFLQRRRLDAENKPQPLSREQRYSLMAEEFPHIAMAKWEGQTLSDLAGSQDGRAKAAALLMLLEGEQRLMMRDEDINRCFESLNIERPNYNPQAFQFPFSGPDILNADRFDPSSASDEELVEMVNKVQLLGAHRAMLRIGEELRKREELMKTPALKMLALSTQLASTEDVDVRLQLLEQLEAAAQESGESPGAYVVEQARLLLTVGRIPEFQQKIQSALAAYPQDPHLLTFVQQLVSMQRSAAGPGMKGSDQSVGGPAAPVGQEPQAGKLVIPGEEENQGAGGSSESGLWLPGQ